VAFEKPIQHELVVDLDMLKLSPKKAADIELAWVISRDGCQKDGLDDYHSQRAALSRFTLAAVLQNEPVLDVLRRELRRVSPDAKIEVDDIKAVLVAEVLKREVLEGDKAQAAKRVVARAANRALRKGGDKGETSDDDKKQASEQRDT